jgi:hypothetical protein
MAALYGRRIRRGMAGTAVAAAAMAVLTASQAPGLDLSPIHHSDAVTPPSGTPIDGGSSYYTQMPPLNAPTGPATGGTDGGAGTGTGTGTTELPATVLDAYQKAESDLRASNPRCNLRWQLLAAIGQVESAQARGGEVDSEGTTIRPILGPVLNGDGFADITDTDNGEYDGDSTRDRAVGPMQFIPSTWAVWGADGNGDGVRDPGNIYDAALAAGHYLCAGGRDLSYDTDLDRAIFGYNHSEQYVDLVKSWYEHFLTGGVVSGADIGPGADRAGSSARPGSGTGSSGYPPGTGASVPPRVSASVPPRRSNASASPSKGSRPTATFSGTIAPTPTSSEIGGSPSGPSPTWTVTTAPPSTIPPTTTSPSPTTTCPTGSASAPATASPSDSPSPTSTPTDDPCATASPSASSSAVSDSPSLGESASGELN